MNFKKAGIFRRNSEGSEQPEVQNDSGGMLAVWGSPGSGKTVTAVKIAKMLSAKKKNVILLLCDMTAPMLPCICSPDELECERSLGNILAAARIGENLIKHNLVTLKRSNYLTVLGLLKGENEYSIPPFTEKQAIELLDGLRQIAPYVIVDCGSYIANDILSAVALMEADSVLRLANCDHKSICLSAFLQATILVAGLMVFKDHALLGLGLTMVTQDEFNRDYFTALASYITLGEQGRVVLHSKTETEVTLDDGSNESP